MTHLCIKNVLWRVCSVFGLLLLCQLFSCGPANPPLRFFEGSTDAGTQGKDGQNKDTIRPDVASESRKETPQPDSLQQDRVTDIRAPEIITAPDARPENTAEAPRTDAGAGDKTLRDNNKPDNGAPDTSTSCPVGMRCPTQFPYTHNGDTSSSSSRRFNRYSCKSSADESGPEDIFRIQVTQAGFLSAAVYDGNGVDVDIHILSSLNEQACLDRGDRGAKVDVTPGVYYVVVDSYTKNGTARSGKYRVDIGLTIPSRGPCGMKTGVMRRVRDQGKALAMPATGPMVKEAHLVTQEERPPYPRTFTDKLQAHYALSQRKTGFVMARSEKWAPLEGGNFYGAGIGSPTLFPTRHEAWYVNMYWTKAYRPARGTRMILRIPGTNRAVVVAAGYETGPGDLSRIGGTTEETHYYLGTTHLGRMTLGIATDQSLPFGPRICQ